MTTTTAPAPPTDTIKRLLPWLVAVAFFMQSLDTTILNTAVPAIAEAMHVTPLDMKSVLASYTLSLAVFIPISGWMADRFGTRRVFACAIGLFTLGSLLCGLSVNIAMLVACRVVQGMGGAMMVPVGRMTMVRTFPKSELIRAMSFVSIPSLIGPMLGPISGGLIVHYLDWSVVFFVNIPVGLAGLLLVYRFLPDYRESSTHPIDIVGLILFGSGISLLSYVLEVFGENSLGDIEMAGLLLLSGTLLAGYGIKATHTPFPLLQLSLFRLRTFRAAVSGSFFSRLGLGGLPFLFPLLYQVGLGYSPVQSGLLVMPQALAAMGLKVIVPRILARLGYRNVLVVNTLTLGVLIMLFATIDVGTPAWRIALQAFILGFFTSTQYTSMNTLVYADVGARQTSAASTIASTGQQMSISFGIASASLIAAMFVPASLRSDPTALIHGVHQAFIVLGIMTMASSVIFMGLKKNDGGAISGRKLV
ncbi:DHA2 family efflux MFS transporter permease subunit [Enhydrobacter sp.]|jgi:EmrB/QacA subfamily drug resistance transporter|uniref:DHA2 family efflux MFS transporter permease subunit n=1 Tax=Enhydrobacter sp. TaxID=1894999 RepID=UPI002610FD9F|nr:DHA2 family efflux MFS transporter permease subunit [Enhydrobacter sp.]WIM13150.1 MAG: putative MFS-type transporter [Enhydrobacter sp.]